MTRWTITLIALVLTACSKKPADLDQSSVVAPPGLEERFLAPQGMQWGFFQNAAGVRLRYSHVPVRGVPAATAVLLTGHTEFAEKYFETMRELNARGIEIWQMDWRGYGGSDRYLADREKAHSHGVLHDVGDVHQFVTEVVKPASNRVFLIAHSMGGNISLRYLHDHPETFAFAIIGSPFLSMGPNSAQSLPDWVVRTVVWGSCFLGLCEAWSKGAGPWQDEDFSQELSHDPVRSQVQRAWFRANPTLRIGGVTNGWAREYIRSHDVLADSKYLGEIRTPMLLGTATADPVTRSDVHVTACAAMANCMLASHEDALHELFMESDGYRQRWMSSLYSFAASHGVQ
jgi:lysophospholipase